MWLAAAALFVHQVSTEGSPPRIAQWDGPVEDGNLPSAAFLFEDEAWLIRSARIDGVESQDDAETPDHRLVVVHIDLPSGRAETGWDLLPILGGRSTELRGVARRADGGITLLLRDRPGLRAVSLLRDRGVVDHGALEVASDTHTLGVIWDGDQLRAALDDGSAITWGDGSPTLERIEGVPGVDEADLDPNLPPWVRALRLSSARAALARRQALAAARWTARGWDVLVWEAPNQWRWTLSRDEAAAPETGARYGALGSRHTAFDERVASWPLGLGEPPNREVRTNYSAPRIVRASGEGIWENAAPAGGFWDWCLPHPERWVCVSHAPLEHRTRIFDGDANRSSEVHGRFSPADPVLVEASGGGFWILDVSHTSADGRIYYRLNDDLTRADPMSWSERYRHARPRTREEARAWQATSGPSAMMVMDNDTGESIHLFFATLALPVQLFGFPAATLLFLLFALALRRPPFTAALISILLFGIVLGVQLVMATGYLRLLSYV